MIRRINNQLLKHEPRTARGTLIIELATAAFTLLIFSILAVHLLLVVNGAYINDRACRDATRAAAQGMTPTEARRLAATILESHDSRGYVGKPTIRGAVVYEDYNGSPPPARSPYVRVTTQTRVNMPFGLLNICGETFQDGNITFVQSYTFPIVRVR